MFDSETETPLTPNAGFPSPIKQNGRLYFFRSQLEAYKRALAGLPPEPWKGVDELVPATLTAREFGFGRRTLGRRIAGAVVTSCGAQAAASASPGKPALCRAPSHVRKVARAATPARPGRAFS